MSTSELAMDRQLAVLIDIENVGADALCNGWLSKR